MSVPKSEYKVYIYKNDYNALCTEVYRHQQIETGGNLFGLWTTSGSAVIHVVLGPGKNCKRTDTSFHQDIEYLKRVGSFVNQKYMLCHIGEWHSHHCLSLSKPSRGDELTIERNFPRGMTKFLVIIANIKDRDQILLSPYFFTHDGTRYEKAVVEVLKSDSPFSSDVVIAHEIELGSEGNATEEQNGSTSPIRLHADHRSPISQANPSSSHANINGEEPMDTTDDDLYPSRDYDGASASSVSATSPSQGTTPSSLVDPYQDRNTDDTKASEKDITMKKIHDELKKWFGDQRDSMFELSDSKDCPEIKFKHHHVFWMVRFPEHFPTNPAKLFSSYDEKNLFRSSSECSRHEIVQPLNNKVNVLLSIKKRCSSQCHICKNFSKELLSLSDSNPRQATINKVLHEIMLTMDVDDLKMQCPCNSETVITFKHSFLYWIINFPAEFHNIPAKVYYLRSETSLQRHDAIVCPNDSHGQRALNSSELIIKAIYLNCGCMKCNQQKSQHR